MVIASLSAIFTSFLILSIQVMAASGTFQDGANSIISTFKRRVISTSSEISPIYQEANNASTWSILKIYLQESYFFRFHVPYSTTMIIFAFTSVIYILADKFSYLQTSASSKGTALITTIWFSVLGTLGWYTIFKSIAYYHTHMNYLPWHMPFTLFGFGLCGYAIQISINWFIDKYWKGHNS